MPQTEAFGRRTLEDAFVTRSGTRGPHPLIQTVSAAKGVVKNLVTNSYTVVVVVVVVVVVALGQK